MTRIRTGGIGRGARAVLMMSLVAASLVMSDRSSEAAQNSDGLMAQGAVQSSKVPASTTHTKGEKAAISDDDLEYLRQAAQDGRAAIENARLALEKSQSPQVRSFAQQMVSDHEAAQRQLIEIAQRKGADLQDDLSLRQKVQSKVLTAVEASHFDRAFARQVGVGAHEHAVRLHQRAATKGDDEQIRDHAARQIPMLRALLNKGLALERSTGLADREATGAPSR